MAAANGVFRFRGASGQTYNLSAFWDDTANHFVLFDQSQKASATSPDYWKPPETVVLQDVVLEAATANTTSTQLLRSSRVTGDILLDAIHLAAIAFRPVLNVAFGVGDLVQARALA
jgi:hypothetical protein